MKQIRKIMMVGCVALLSSLSLANCSSESTSVGNTTPTSASPLAGLATCEAQENGTICGTLYAPDGSTPLANAEIQVSDSSGNLVKLDGLRSVSSGTRMLTANADACLSDATGAFACVCDSAGGDLTFSVDSALIDFTFTADCSEDEITEVPVADTTADADETQTLAVVTGAYDKVEVVLADMFDCGTVTDGELDYGTECSQMHIFDGGSRIGFGDTDPNNGDTEYRTVEDLLTDPDLMDDYDMILLNCGLDDALASDETVQANIAAYVADGGRVYGSDWAYNFIEQTFPSIIDFYGADGTDGLSDTAETEDVAKAGSSNSDQTVNVEDASLLTFLQTNDVIDDAATTASINFNLGSWVVMDTADGDASTLLSADSLENGPSGVEDLPIAVLSCDDSSVGGIFYASYHTEIGTVTDEDDAQEAILRYMILNGFNSCTGS